MDLRAGRAPKYILYRHPARKSIAPQWEPRDHECSSTPEELVARCAELGMSSMTLLEGGSVSGLPRFHLAAKKLGIRAHLRAEVTCRLHGLSRPAIAPNPLVNKAKCANL